MRRLVLQSRAAAMIDAVRSAVGDELLDVWLDQDNGGRLSFLTSRLEEARASLGSEADSGEILVIRGRHTATELRGAEETVRTRLGTEIKDVEVGIDWHNESIAVRYGGTDAARGAAIRSLAGSVAGAQIPVVADTSGPPPPGQQRGCTILACDPPMRGGVRLHIHRDLGHASGPRGSCTTGFNIRGSNGWLYVLTAGHCVTNSGSGRALAYHNGLPVAWEKSTTNDTDFLAPANTNYSNNTPPRYDWALMPY